MGSDLVLLLIQREDYSLFIKLSCQFLTLKVQNGSREIATHNSYFTNRPNAAGHKRRNLLTMTTSKLLRNVVFPLKYFFEPRDFPSFSHFKLGHSLPLRYGVLVSLKLQRCCRMEIRYMVFQTMVKSKEFTNQGDHNQNVVSTSRRRATRRPSYLMPASHRLSSWTQTNRDRIQCTCSSCTIVFLFLRLLLSHTTVLDM